jgi:DNA-binding transcriptional ArsR family regulator
MKQAERLSSTFSALADPTRRAILHRLSKGEATVMDLAKPFAMSQPAISKHLRVLEGAGLITRGRDAQRRPCKIVGKPLAEANAWLEKYRQCWQHQFEKLDDLLAEMQAPDKSDKKT